MATLRPMPAEPAYLKAATAGRPIGVDREAKVLRGYVVAQAGPFKSAGRGEFDLAALKTIVKLGNAAPNGLKSRFTHPDESNDGLGKLLGRSRKFTLDEATNEAGETVPAVRADLHFSPTASRTPSGDLAGYVMDLAADDPAALSSSLVLKVDMEYRLEKNGTPKKDENGEPLPPLWRPTLLRASDIVDTGDAVDGLLSADAGDIDVDGLPAAAVWRGVQYLDGVFGGQPRDVTEARLLAFLDRYLTRRYGPSADGVNPVLGVLPDGTISPVLIPGGNDLRRRRQLLRSRLASLPAAVR